MSKQLHKNFVDEQEKLLLKSYMDKKIKINYILSILGIKRRRFFNFATLFNSNLFNINICFKVLKFPTPWFNYGNSFFT